MTEYPIVEDLCSTSKGVNLFLNAESQLRQKKIPRSIRLFEEASRSLEEEIKNTLIGPNRLLDLVRKLHICYQKLTVEAGLPDELRAVPLLPNDLIYYNRRYIETEQELKRLEESLLKH